MKLLLIATVLALTLVAVPVDDLVVGRAAAVVCDPDDVDCQVRQLRCLIRAILFGGFCPA